MDKLSRKREKDGKWMIAVQETSRSEREAKLDRRQVDRKERGIDR